MSGCYSCDVLVIQKYNMKMGTTLVDQMCPSLASHLEPREVRSMTHHGAQAV